MTLAGLLVDSAVALVILLAALGVGHWILRLLRIEEHGVGRLWLATTCGLGVMSVSTMLIGTAGLLYRVLFAVLLTPPAITGVLLLVTRLDWWHEGRRWLAWSRSEPPF